MKKWYQYQKERFPFWFYLPFSAAFTWSTMCLAGSGRKTLIFLYLWFMVLSFFMLFRIADEHKDYEEDCIKHPERPVQRKLVSLTELKNLGVALLIAQILITILFYPIAVPIYAIVLFYFLLMTKEFYSRTILKKHPFIYGALHQIVLVLLDYLIIITSKLTYQVTKQPMYFLYVIGRFLCFFSVFLCKERHKKSLLKLAYFLTALYMGVVCYLYL